MSAVGAEPTGGYLRDLLDVDFTPEQLAIATHPLCPQLVVAGAGSGKTMVMAARVVHAVAFHGLPPGRVLGLTFTNKAAGELSERVRRSLARLPPRDPEDADEADDLPTVSTYHSYAASLVRDHALRIGREPYTALLTEATQWQLATRVVRRAEGPFEHLQWTTGHVAGLVLALAGDLAEHLADVDTVRAFDAKVGADVRRCAKPVAAVTEIAERAASREELLTLVEAYERAKERLELIDYGDQVALAARIVEAAPAVGAAERARYALVVLDEYQDTGVAQRVLLSRLFGGGHPVTAVGDPNQAIYGWRGASVGNLLRFADHFRRSDGSPVTPQPLMTSFRCGGRILAAANAVAGALTSSPATRRRPVLGVPTLAPRTGHEDEGRVAAARVRTDEDEAGWVADALGRQLAEGTPAGQMAVLARRRSDFPRLHRALVERDLPVEVVGLGGLLEMPEVADVVAVLSLLVDATANAAAVRLLTGPRWRLGPRDLAALGRRAARLATWTPPDTSDEPPVSSGLDEALRRATDAVDPVDVASLLDAVFSPGPPQAYSAPARDRIAAFVAEVAGLRRLVGQPLVDLVSEVVRTTGLDVEIEAAHERVAVARAANLAAFVDHAARFSGLEGESDLPAFLGFLEAAADADDGLDVGAVSTADTVKLMTVHKAKGLEWDVVAVPGLVADVFPSNKGRTPWTRGAHVLPFDCRGDAADLPVLADYSAAAVRAFTEECRADDRDEERRLAYVAFTRARRLLLASGYCWSSSRLSPCAASPFLDELRAVGPPAVLVDCWCDDPVEEANPLTATAGADVPWPAPYDAPALAARRRAAALVEEARAGRVPPVPVDGDDALRVDAWADEARLLLDELRAERVAVRDVPLPSRLTASQIVALAHDPDALAASLARPMPARPAPQARRGSRFHRWVEEIYAAAPLLEPDDLPGAGDADVSDDELAMLQQQFVAAGWADRRPVAVEQPFELVVGGRLVRGRIDAVYGRPEGGYDVIDFKTGDVPSDFAAASMQLSVYRLAWADLAGVDPSDVDAGFLYVRSGSVKRPDRLLDRDELTRMLTG